ncbi:MAG TPA: hypothetical protein PL124_10810 [Candidatus Cloacimonadota bacterium]|nr:hypothetical protein [Candidatus Cloacimonadota bacterium]
MDFAFPGLTHNALGRQEADAKAFAKVLGGSDMVDALAKTIGEAYQRAIISADVKTELRYNPESRMPMYAGGWSSLPYRNVMDADGLVRIRDDPFATSGGMTGGMNIVPHMLRAFDMMLAGTSDRYSPNGLAARAMRHQGMSSRQMSKLLGMDMGDEGDFIRTHKVPIPEPELPFVGLPSEHQPVDWTKGTVTPARYQFAKMVKEMSKTFGKERAWDIMTQIARTGTGSNVAQYLNQRTSLANADIDEMSIFPGDVMADALIQEENITTDMRLRGGGAAGAPLKYGQESLVDATHVISKGIGTEGRKRPKMPKRTGALNRAFEILNQKTLKQLLPIGLAAGIGLVAEHFMPGAGMMMGGMMAGVTTGGNWNDFIAQYTAENPVPTDPEEKKKYYELARAIHSGPSTGVQAAASMLAGGGLGGAGSSNAKAKTIRMTDAYKDMLALATPTTPGATGARVGIEMQYPISEKSTNERIKVDARMTETLDKLSKLGFERIGSKAEMASYGDRAYSNKFAVAGGKIDYSKPEEAKVMLENAAKIISESGAENIFFNKTETNRHETGVMNAISTLMGRSPGTYGEGLGKTNVMSIKGKFAFTPEQAEQMKTVREQLEGMGKDIQITEYQTSELDDANQRVSKSYLEVDQNIPLNKTNDYGKKIEDTVTGFSQQTTGIEGSIKAMRTYDDSMENSTTWTDKLISKGKDINKFSWQLTMLSLGALGVYFSMMGIVGLIKQGASAIISPLQDLEGMIKNSILADVFGFGSTGSLADKIGASFNVQGGIASFTDALAGLGASIFGDPDVMASIKDTFLVLQKFFEDPNTKQTVRDIFKGIAESVQSIVNNAGPVLEVLKAAVTPTKNYPIVGGMMENAPFGLGDQSALSVGTTAMLYAAAVMGIGSAASFVANAGGKGMMWGGKGIQAGQKVYRGLSKLISGPTASETIGDTAAKMAAGGPIGQTAADQTSWISKLFGKRGGGASAGLAFTSQDWRMMTATSDEERAKIAKEWNVMENPLEWMKQQVSGGIGYRTKQTLGEGAWPSFMEASQKDTSKNWFMGMDLASLFGGGTTTGTEQTDVLAKKIASEVPVNQTITITFVIQGNMDQKAGESAISSLSDFFKAYAKGNTPGSV